MTQIFVNNYSTTVAATFGATDTYLQVASVAGFPALNPGDTCDLTVFRLVGVQESDWEVVQATALVGNQFTVVRSVEGAAASQFEIGDRIEARVTAASLMAKADDAATTAAIATKADTAFVTTELNLKANVSDMTVALNLKLDTTAFTAANIGLGNVDDTADNDKPVSGPQQTALNLKANSAALAAVAFSGLKADVGLGSVDDTSDTNKPVSTAQAAADTASVASAKTYTDAVVASAIGGLPPSGIHTVGATITANATLTSASAGYQPIQMATMGQSVTFPDATTLQVGGPTIILDNSKGAYPAGLRDNTGGLIMAVGAGGIAYAALKDKSTPAGVWSITGSQLEPGLVSIDNPFSSTYLANTVYPMSVALDSNTSIHFAKIASGFVAFVVDNLGKVVTVPVTVDATGNSFPVAVFKIDSTHAIVFYGPNTTTNKCVVLSLSGASPSLLLTVNTPQTFATNMGTIWSGENSVGAPAITQLAPGLFVTVYAASTVFAFAISVSGTTITLGTPFSIGPAFATFGMNTVYALTSTTVLLLYFNTNTVLMNAVILTVSGTTITAGTPVATPLKTSNNGVPVASCLISPTKAMILLDNNTATSLYAVAFTIAGTTVTAGTAYAITTALSLTTQNMANYVNGNGSSRYNPPLLPITVGSVNNVFCWYADNNGTGSCQILSENAGTITSGPVVSPITTGTSNVSNGYGQIFPQSSSELMVVKNTLLSTAGYGLMANTYKLSGTTVTQGVSLPINTIPTGLPIATRTANGDYVLSSAVGTMGNIISVLRSNGDKINNRGVIGMPSIGYTTQGFGLVSANRIVYLGSTTGNTSGTLRLISVEIAQ